VIRAVLFDVDGTLYHQRPLQIVMAAELGLVPWGRQAPWRVPRLWRLLSAFRHVREELRGLGRPELPLARLQFTAAAARTGADPDELERVVEEWIYRRPLKHLPRVVREGTSHVLAELQRRGLATGVFSDYPVAAKLDAMQLRQHVNLELDATDAAINAFKPHPRGLLAACEQWGLPPSSVLYVGDREDVDARGAASAGMPCAILGSDAGGGTDCVRVRRMTDVLSLVDGGSR
jgi:FMN phosphatase YigB (HAD superfamily)